MRQDQLDHLFSQLPVTDPPADLLTRILNRITKEQLRRLERRQVVMVLALTVVATASLVYSLWDLGSRSLQSGFWELLRLGVVEPAVWVTSGYDYFLSLAESLPTSSLLLMLATGFLYLEGLKLIARQAAKAETAAAQA
jgi:hypothetical protein